MTSRLLREGALSILTTATLLLFWPVVCSCDILMVETALPSRHRTAFAIISGDRASIEVLSEKVTGFVAAITCNKLLTKSPKAKTALFSFQNVRVFLYHLRALCYLLLLNKINKRQSDLITNLYNFVIIIIKVITV